MKDEEAGAWTLPADRLGPIRRAHRRRWIWFRKRLDGRAWKWVFAFLESRTWIVASVVFGIVGPAICLGAWCEELVFGFGSLGTRIVFFAAAEILLLAVWLIRARRAKGSAAFFASALVLGACASLALTPLSSLAATLHFSEAHSKYADARLEIALGVLGFVPFVSAFVYFMNGIRAAHVADMRSSAGSRAGRLISGFLTPLIVAWFATMCIQSAANRGIVDLVEGDEARAARSIAWLKIGWPLVDLYSLERITKDMRVTDPKRATQLENAYREITGHRFRYRASEDK